MLLFVQHFLVRRLTAGCLIDTEEAKAAGATIVGAEDLVELVQSGKLEFDRCIATPDVMPLVGRVARVRCLCRLSVSIALKLTLLLLDGRSLVLAV